MKSGSGPAFARWLAVAVAACVALAVPAIVAAPAEADSYGPSTMFTPPSGAPSPGVLYPRALQLEYSGINNGTMLATWENYTNGTPAFPVYRSTDNGHTWSPYSTIVDTVNGWGLRYQPFLYELPSPVGNYPAGTILAFGNSIPSDGSHTKIDMYASADHGLTWTFVSSVASGGPADITDGVPAIWEPSALARNGKLIVFYSDQSDPAHAQKIVHKTTTDMTTWSASVDDVATPSYGDRPGMPVVAALPNGTWIMSYEYGGAPERNFAVYYKISNDPENWGSTTGHVVADTLGNVPASSPYVAWMPSGGPNGTVVISGQTDSGLYLNTDLGKPGRWIHVPTQVANAYSRALVPLNDGHTLFIMSAGMTSSTNTVTYGAVDLGSSMTSGATYKIVNRNSGLVMGVQNMSTSPGGTLLQWTDTGTADHLWTVNLQSSGYWHITNVNSGLLVGISGMSTANGAPALQWTDNGTNDHNWIVAPYPGGGFIFANANSGKFMEIGNASTAQGAAVQQWQETDCSCQVWTLGN